MHVIFIVLRVQDQVDAGLVRLHHAAHLQLRVLRAERHDHLPRARRRLRVADLALAPGLPAPVVAAAGGADPLGGLLGGPGGRLPPRPGGGLLQLLLDDQQLPPLRHHGQNYNCRRYSIKSL